MWPAYADAWLSAFPKEVLFHRLRSDLRRFPVLALHWEEWLSQLAAEACDEAIALANVYRCHPGFFVSREALGQWLTVVTRRGALQHVLDVGEVRQCLDALPDGQRQVL